MREPEPVTETMKISEVKNALSSLVNKVYRKETRVLVEKSGIPVAALVSAEDLRRLTQLDQTWDARTRAIERFSQAFADVPTEEAEAEVARIIAEHRQRGAAEAEHAAGVIIAVLDTNVLASGFIGEDKPDSTPGEIVRRWRAKSYTLVVSEHILAELIDTFTDPYFTRRLSASAIAEALESLRIDAVVQPITVDVAGVASHVEDDAVLATALSAGASYLVTGDRRLLERRSYQDTHLLSPREFLARLALEGDLER